MDGDGEAVPGEILGDRPADPLGRARHKGRSGGFRHGVNPRPVQIPGPTARIRPFARANS